MHRVCAIAAACALLCALCVYAQNVPVPQWYADNYVLAPRPSNNDWDSVSVKDPTIVYDGGLWHCFFTMMDGTNWRMGYASATTIAGLRTAPRTRMSVLGSGGWMCAPQVFFFRPHNKWYMIYNSGITSTTTVGIPSSWAPPRGMPWSDGIDYAMISDETNVYAFYSAQDGSGTIKTRHTSVANFPFNGWSAASVAATDTFEGPNCYHSLADGKYYLTPEDMSRHYELWVADTLAGPFKKLQENWAAGSNTKDLPGVTHWTDQVSHGELIRASFDERINIADINHCDFLIQGVTSALAQGDYGKIPYKLGIIRNYPCPNGGSDCTPNPNSNSTDPCATVSCGAHGSCNGGACVCRDGYTGASCNIAPVPSTGPAPVGTTICATASEGQQASLSCPAGKTITAITFASYGLPSGSCPSFTAGSCHASSSVAQVQSACVGKSSCSVAASNNVFGDPCSGRGKTLDIAATCA